MNKNIHAIHNICDSMKDVQKSVYQILSMFLITYLLMHWLLKNGIRGRSGSPIFAKLFGLKAAIQATIYSSSALKVT